MLIFAFSVLDWKCPFWINLVQNIKFASLKHGDIINPCFKLKFSTGLFKCAKFNVAVHFFRFLPEMHFLGKFCPKYQNSQIKLKFGT